MAFDFNDYMSSFNGADEEAFVRKFYTEDLIVDGPVGVINGRQKWLEALTFVHMDVQERLYPRTVMREGDTILAQIDGEFTATADRADFPYGPLKTGQSVKVKMLAMYRILGDQISRITLASWPASAGVA